MYTTGHHPRHDPIAAVIVGAVIALLTGCADDSSSSKGRASLTFTSSVGATTAALNGFRAVTVQPGVVLTDFRISIREIEFERQDEDMTDETDDPEFEGPFQFDLLNGDTALSQTIGDVTIPAGIYEGIEFDMHKSSELTDTSDPLFDRSIFIAGTIEKSGVPTDFEMWHDTNEEFFLTGPNGFVVEEGTKASALVVDFDLENLLFGIDLLSAVELPPGFIDISPDSASAINQNLADLLKDNIDDAADFGEDDDGDGDLSEDEDVDDDI